MEIFTGLLMLLEMFSFVSSFQMAKLFNTRSTITSSTLAWSPIRPGESLPPNVVPIGSGGPSWCRTREHAIWVSGAVVDEKCRVPFLGSVHVADNYQVLVSLNGSSRLVMELWDNLVAFPPNIVSTPDMLLAISQDVEGGAVLPGFVDPNERRAHFLKGNEAVKLFGGLLITEIEPIAYRLNNVLLGEKTERRMHDDILQEFTLENAEDNDSTVKREIFFNSPRIVYFGKMKGTIVGLPTFVSGPDIYPVNITWGITNELFQNRSVVASYILPGKSSVRARLVAVVLNLEGAYSGQLTSMYNDGVEMKRFIEGLHTERKIIEVRAEFDQTFSLHDGTPYEHLPSQSIILLHSTTTTQSPIESREGEKAISGSTSHNQYLPEPQEVGVNAAGHLTSIWIISLLFLCLRNW